METILATAIITKMYEYLLYGASKLIPWLQENLPEIHGANWWDYVERSKSKKDKTYFAKELNELDLQHLLKTALKKDNFASLCKHTPDSRYSYEERRQILVKMKKVRNNWAHISRFPPKWEIEKDLNDIIGFYNLFKDSDIIESVNDFIDTIRKREIIDDIYEKGRVSKNINEGDNSSSHINPQSDSKIEDKKEKAEKDFFSYIENTANESAGLKIDKVNGKCVVKGIGSCNDSIIVIPKTKKIGNISYPVSGIADRAFYCETKIEGIILPNGMQFIGKEAFSKCTSLKNISIPNSIKHIGQDAFLDCISIYGLYINDVEAWVATEFEHTDIRNTVQQYSNPLAYAQKLYLNGIEIKRIQIPEGVESVNDLAFYGCSFLEDVIFPNSMIVIGAASFHNCVSLESINLPESVLKIGKYAFYGCTGIEKIYFNSVALDDTSLDDTIFGAVGISQKGVSVFIGARVKKIPANLFNSINVKDNYQLDSIANIVNVKFDDDSICSYIGNNAFGGCIYLKYINLPDTITYIGEYAFFDCISLKQITIPHNVENIDKCAFNNSGIVKIIISEGVKSIGDGAFASCSAIRHILIPSSVIYLGEGIFRKSLTLCRVTILARITKIPSRTFMDCTALDKIDIPSSVEEIGDSAFSGCTALSCLKMSDNVKIIGEKAFYECSSLQTVTIPENVLEIHNYAYDSCTAIKQIEFNAVNMSWECEDIFNSAGIDGEGITVFIGKNVTRIPAGLFLCDENFIVNVIFREKSHCLYIGDAAFCCCTYLRSINIPQSVIEIGKNAFDNTAITSISIPNGISTISDCVFSRCELLEKVNVPSSVTKICDSAFEDCSSLNNINLPESLTYIGNFAFSGCSSLKNITIPEKVKFIGRKAFCDCMELDNIFYNATNASDIQSKDVFYAAGYYSKNMTITIGANVIKIPAYLFSGDSVISLSGESCGELFGFCNVRKVVFVRDSNCQYIGKHAFEECYNLTTIFIPESLMYVNEDAFLNCPALKNIYFYGNILQWTEFWFSSSQVIYFYSDEMPEQDSDEKFWHYDENGNPVEW